MERCWWPTTSRSSALSPTEGLKGLGYQVLVAENGKQALEIYEQHRREIDCVLLDLIMPELSGLETFRRMRAIDPQVRVVFASGYSTGEILRDAPDARSAEFIGKPYTLEGLSLALAQSGDGPAALKVRCGVGDRGAWRFSTKRNGKGSLP